MRNFNPTRIKGCGVIGGANPANSPNPVGNAASGGGAVNPSPYSPVTPALDFANCVIRGKFTADIAWTPAAVALGQIAMNTQISQKFNYSYGTPLTNTFIWTELCYPQFQRALSGSYHVYFYNWDSYPSPTPLFDSVWYNTDSSYTLKGRFLSAVDSSYIRTLSQRLKISSASGSDEMAAPVDETAKNVVTGGAWTASSVKAVSDTYYTAYFFLAGKTITGFTYTITLSYTNLVLERRAIDATDTAWINSAIDW